MALTTLRQVVGGLTRRVAREVASRVPTADLDERDPDYIRNMLPGAWLVASLYFRAEVRGLEHVPAEGPVLLVGNHSGGNLSPDTTVFTLAFTSYFGAERCFYQLAHNVVMLVPWLSRLRKFGTVAASAENARRALRRGCALLVYPGGDMEVHRPTWEGGKVDFAGRSGFLRLAIEEDAPVVPVVSVGGQETALFLTRGDRLARLLHLDQMLRLHVLPVSVSLPWGLNVGDFTGHLPLPAKITTEVLRPINLRARYGEHPDLDEVYADATGVMQEALARLAAERRFPVVG